MSDDDITKSVKIIGGDWYLILKCVQQVEDDFCLEVMEKVLSKTRFGVDETEGIEKYIIRLRSIVPLQDKIADLLEVEKDHESYQKMQNLLKDHPELVKPTHH